ncbi:uncharacterized protein RHIMIDRAFT_280459 [Rhizopus microsporus ATCC 52813]|uniref:Uncharacterized protein n=1 Tax=Rhizopus microsporus ATCC 52813 TaxID=1340429 RepID=A0A2G4SYD9_RHIZD|nr:uncharacterized protein RHIMIDRAFT_280459 [Rhizopus microsporus ATCC 52813]PHZ13779.1 hypothetical protein RHIMIDRAFT_280459 [Rhizopus microsporus ATCC 52813]
MQGTFLFHGETNGNNALVMTKTAIASQGKNNITETSVTILDWYNSSNLFHCWKAVCASIASFN